VQSRVGPDADTPVIIPDSLVAVQAFVMWEQAGKPQVGQNQDLCSAVRCCAVPLYSFRLQHYPLTHAHNRICTPGDQ
jgi:hypothetical protein